MTKSAKKRSKSAALAKTKPLSHSEELKLQKEKDEALKNGNIQGEPGQEGRSIQLLHALFLSCNYSLLYNHDSRFLISSRMKS